MIKMVHFSSDRTNLVIFALILLTIGFGLNILLASSSFLARQAYGDPYFYLKKQAMFALLGTTLFIILSQVSYKFWKGIAWPLYLMSLIALILVFIPGFGKTAGGSSRWIYLFELSFQPSDLAKFATVLVLARLYSKDTELKWSTIIISLIVIMLPVLLISAEPDLGTVIHLLLSSGFLLLLTGFPLRVMAGLLVASIPFAYHSVVNVPYRWKRVKAFLDPYHIDNRYDGAYQLVASFKSFDAGQWLGKGFGEGIRRHNLQARHTDFILAIVAEDLGLVGVVVLLLLLFTIALYGLFLMSKIEETFPRLLGSGVFLLFILQVLLNVAVTLGLVPTTGINLPLISYGGTSLIMHLVMFGIVLNITRTAESQNTY